MMMMMDILKTLLFTSIVILVVGTSRSGAQEKGAIIGKKCDYRFTSKSNQFSSPGYPEYYPNNATCTWKIVVESGFHIQLTIIEVDMESSKHCEFDSITIYDGENETAIPLRKVCGKNLPEKFQSVSNVLTITLETDSSYTGRGFKMKYESKPACTSVYRDFSGSAQSPGFPLGYPDSAFCTYEFFGVNGKYIHLYFEEFELEEMQHYECFDYVAVLTSSNDDDDDKLEGQFCGNSLKKSGICFEARKVTIRFVTDSAFSLSGFKTSFMVSNDKCRADEDIKNLEGAKGEAVMTEDIQEFNRLVQEELGGTLGNPSKLPLSVFSYSSRFLSTSSRETSTTTLERPIITIEPTIASKVQSIDSKMSHVALSSSNKNHFKARQRRNSVASFEAPQSSAQSDSQKLALVISLPRNVTRSTILGPSVPPITTLQPSIQSIKPVILPSITSPLIHSIPPHPTSSFSVNVHPSENIAPKTSSQIANNDKTTLQQQCLKYVSVEIKGGALPLSNLKDKHREQIQYILNSNITTIWEVAWPYTGLMGREGGLLHYGTLMKVNDKSFLLYILGRKFHLVELTRKTMKQYKVEMSMVLNENLSVPLSKHLKKIPSGIKMTVQLPCNSATRD